ncbi:hypothetical protein MN608_08313 [Microdochium nivale]|nr:hypothetical protein MN608_08313 [Microdochium nivale]
MRARRRPQSINKNDRMGPGRNIKSKALCEVEKSLHGLGVCSEHKLAIAMSSPTAPATTTTTTTTTPKTLQRSRRACTDPVGNGTGQGALSNYKGCAVCHNQDHYGRGSSVCSRCSRCHGCGSSNNGIGPIQAVYFGGKAVVKKARAGLSRTKDSEEAEEAEGLVESK